MLFARHHAHVAIVDRDEAAARRTADAIGAAGGHADVWPCDVADGAAVARTFDAIRAAHPRIDILVNNAGISHVGTIERTTEAELDRLYAVNVKGVFLCARAAVPIMLAQGGGVILNMASIASLIGLPDRFAYSMTKGAVLSMTRSIAVDYVKQNIRCNCICPARVHTPFVDQYVPRHYPRLEREMPAGVSACQPI